MKTRKLKDILNKLDESKLDNDIMINCSNKHYHVIFAKNINYNKRDNKFTSRVFLIQATENG